MATTSSKDDLSVGSRKSSRFLKAPNQHGSKQKLISSFLRMNSGVPGASAAERKVRSNLQQEQDILDQLNQLASHFENKNAVVAGKKGKRKINLQQL